MSESLSLLLEVGGGGGGSGGESGGVIDVVEPIEFWSTDLELPSVIESSSTCSRLMSTSAVDGPLQLCVCRSAGLISSKAVLGGGVLLHVSVRASGYSGGRVPPETSPNFLRAVDV